MKKIIFSLIILFSLNAEAQECKGLLFTQGAEFEYKTFNDKDKPQSIAKHKVVSATPASAEIKADITDEKGKPSGSVNYTVKCEAGTYMVDMRTMFSPEQLKTNEGTEMKIEGDHLDVPTEATPGKALKNGKVTLSMITSMFTMNNTITITNRKVVGKETITTPAGTFECIKISYDVETKFGIKVSGKGEEWYSEEHGTVQSKSYTGKGKLQSYTQLTSIKK